ncbi:MAG: tetratricopeptide repeat protein [Chlamydiales bacterium]
MEKNPLLVHETTVKSGRDLDTESVVSNKDSNDQSAQRLCKEAEVLFQYGVAKKKEFPLLLAFDKLIRAKEIDPLLFVEEVIWHQLRGQILFYLGYCFQNYSFLGKSFKPYAEINELHHQDKNLVWDYAQFWTFIAIQSGEKADLTQALSSFSAAARLGCDSSLFYIDWAIAYIICSSYTGNSLYLNESCFLLKKVIRENYDMKGVNNSIYGHAYKIYAHALKKYYYNTHLKKTLEDADISLREVTLLFPSQSDLWLEWGELYLHAGWIDCDLKMIEMGIDKLTSLTLKEVTSTRLTALLGKGLVILGLYLDDLKPMSQGRERILATLESSPEDLDLLNSAGMAELTYGIYFSSKKHYANAIYWFKKGIGIDSTSVCNWHGLFQSYLGLGFLEKNLFFTHKGLTAIKRVCKMRPQSAIYLNDLGLCLLQLNQFENCKNTQSSLLEEAILHFTRSYAIDSRSETLYNWGHALSCLGSLSEAIEDYEKALDILSSAYRMNPEKSNVSYELAIVLFRLGKLLKKTDYLYESIKLLEPLANSHIEDEVVWGDLGYILLTLSELISDENHPFKREDLRQQAEKRLHHAVRMGNREANYHLASLYSLARLFESSIFFLKRAHAFKVLPNEDDLIHNAWLDNLRKTDIFKEFMKGQSDG